MLTKPSQSSASNSVLNFLLPLALVRSATIRKLLSCRNSVNPYRLEQPGVLTATRVIGVRVPTTSRSALMCSLVVPQHPPTIPAPNSSMNRRIAAPNPSGRKGYSVRPSTRIGRPALGITLNGRFQYFAKYAMCSAISVGPVAQFKPRLAIGNGRNAFTTAAMSEPSNMVPVVSMVTLARIGMSSCVFPTAPMASRHALIAHFTCSRS